MVLGTAVLDAASSASSGSLISGRLSARPEARLGQLLGQLESLAVQQRDVSFNTRELAMAPEDGALVVGRTERFGLREHAFAQLATKLQIPAHYLRRCEPELRAENVNRWLREQDREVFLRLEGGEVRAVLSPSYRPINHLDILRWLEQRLGNVAVRYELTEAYLDLQVVRDGPVNLPAQSRDPLHRGVHLRNSEIGAARVSVSAMVYRTICLNGLILGGGQWGYERRHIGKAELPEEVRGAFDKAFELSAQATTAFAGTRGIMVSEPAKVLAKLAERYELVEDEAAALRVAFNVEPGESLYAVVNAITRAGNSEHLPLPSRHKLQTLGGRIVDLVASGKRWLD